MRKIVFILSVLLFTLVGFVSADTPFDDIYKAYKAGDLVNLTVSTSVSSSSNLWYYTKIVSSRPYTYLYAVAPSGTSNFWYQTYRVTGIISNLGSALGTVSGTGLSMTVYKASSGGTNAGMRRRAIHSLRNGYPDMAWGPLPMYRWKPATTSTNYFLVRNQREAGSRLAMFFYAW